MNTPAAQDSGVAAELGSLSQALGTVTRRMEPDFVQLADALSTLHQHAAALSSLGRGLAGTLLGTLQENRFTGDEGLVTVSLGELDDALERSSARLGTLSSMTQLLTDLEYHGSVIERIAFMLQSSVCSFAVESSRTVEGRESFSDFVAGLRDLSAKMRQLGETVVEHCRSGLKDQTEATGEMAAALAELRQLAPQTASAVKVASARVQDMLDASRASLLRIDEHARAIAEHAGTAVYFLQFGDILRQKLEHVVEALSAAALPVAEAPATPAPTPAANGAEPASPSDVSPAARARTLDQCLVVQLAQLEAVREEAKAAHTQLSTAFNRLAEASERLVGEIGVLAGSADGAAALQSLQQDIRQLQTLHQRGEALGAKSVTSAQRVTQLSSTLTGHVEQVTEMNRELHLQALNAIVKTAWLGEIGATLGVLAMHVHDTSKDSTGSVGQILALLGSIRDLTTSLSTADDQVHDDAQKALDRGLSSLSLLSQQFEQSFGEASERAAAQGAVLDGAGARLLFLDTFAEEAAALSGELSRVRFGLAPLLAAAPDVGSSAAPSLATYTMESEREIHRRVLGKKAEDTPAAAAVATTPTGTPAASPSPAASTTAAAASTSNLGDNVELF